MTRTLRLRREALTELAGDDLTAVAGGEYRYTNTAPSCGCTGTIDDIDLTVVTRLSLDSRYCRTFPYC